ncbi:ethanolamine ammonia-lyase reactivating factor EutA [Halobellus captivus]|uniref:ethanolamine ammonia-lyase reactivating factor EutA n=1 Tax=Halobellus captivus TaxID=2592614 RepID=UPI00119D9992|nr:ethanolamine ammonia-lyase reactivating factor EutA [Halobellus captivus]
MTHVPWHEVDTDSLEEVHGIDSIALISVGIDIGTTTTHLMLSRLQARRQGGDYSSEFQIVDREVIYESPIHLTPYKDSQTIDTDRLEELVDGWYKESGYSPEDVDTGAVITTGEASRKENAEAITQLFSERSGNFVCAAAGANLETLMSAHGSGAVDYSVTEEKTVLHVDIGGGTTKLAYIDDGFVEETASINVGARLVTFDDDGAVDHIEEAAQRVADDVGLDFAIGKSLDASARQLLTKRFSDLLFQVTDDDRSTLADSLLVTEPPDTIAFDVMTFAGGGSEYVYDQHTKTYNDLGAELGNAIRNEVNARNIDVAELDVGIRATAVGSNQHTVQVSGNTVTITDREILPLRNIPLVPFVADIEMETETLIDEFAEKLELYDIHKLDSPFAFGFHLHGTPSGDFLDRLLTAVIVNWNEYTNGGTPLIAVFESDLAMSFGNLATDRIDEPIIIVDGIELTQFGYIDIGEPIAATGALPVTVKSLVFEG